MPRGKAKATFSLFDHRLTSCIWNAWNDGQRGTHCASPEDRAAAVALEKRGLVIIQRTDVLCGGWPEWWVRFTPEAAALYAAELAARRAA